MRTYIRAALEYLDLEYLYGQTIIPTTELLAETELLEVDADPSGADESF